MPTLPSAPSSPSDQAAEVVDPSLEADVFSRNCDSRDVLKGVAGRWGVLALVALSEGEMRFGALRRRVDGVSERMLSQTLQTLERDGFIVRNVLQPIPPKVEYSLTPLGMELALKLAGVIDLVQENLPAVMASRQKYDAK